MKAFFQQWAHGRTYAPIQLRKQGSRSSQVRQHKKTFFVPPVTQEAKAVLQPKHKPAENR